MKGKVHHVNSFNETSRRASQMWRWGCSHRVAVPIQQEPEWVSGQGRPCLPAASLHAQLQGGQSYTWKVMLLISFVTHKIYTTSP